MSRFTRAALWLLAAHGAVLALCTFIALLSPAEWPEGQCQGIAGACWPGPRTSAIINLIVFYTPLLAASLLCCLAAVGIVAFIYARDRKNDE